MIAFLATLAFSSNMIGMEGRFAAMSNSERMFFISIAMMGFFTFFVPLFTNTEYRNGVIRNKIIAGYSLKQVFYSHLLTHFSALLIMTVVYMIAGFLGGAAFSGEMLMKNIVLFLALFAYISVLMLMAIRVKRTTTLVVGAFLFLNICYFGVMIGNALIAFVLKGTTKTVGIMIYNMTAFGQWLANTGFGDAYLNPGNTVQLFISTGMIFVMAILSVTGLDKKDLE